MLYVIPTPIGGRAAESLPPSVLNVIRSLRVFSVENAKSARAFLAESERQARTADVCLIVGTSATVYPAASIPEIVYNRGGTLIEVNTDPTPFSSACAAVLRGPSAEFLPQLVAAVNERNARSDERGRTQ